jgi:hypothetical protein
MVKDLHLYCWLVIHSITFTHEGNLYHFTINADLIPIIKLIEI